MPETIDLRKLLKQSNKWHFIRRQDRADILAFADQIECSNISNESHYYDDIATIEDLQRKMED